MIGAKKIKKIEKIEKIENTNFNDLFGNKLQDEETDFLKNSSEEKFGINANANANVNANANANSNILECKDIWKEDQSEFDVKFKKSPFGGYAKKSVEQYLNDQKGSMNNMIKNLEVQINDLTKEKESSYRECEILREQMKKTQKNADETQIKALEIKEKYDGIDKTLKGKYNFLVNENIEYKEAVDILKNENKNSKEKYNEVKNNLNISEKVEKELYIKNEEIKKYKATISESEEKIQQLNNQIENKSLELTNLKGQFTIQERKIDEVVSNYEKKENEFTSANSEFIKQTEELSLLNKEYMNQSKNLNELSNKYYSQTESLNLLNKKFDRQFDKYNELKKYYDGQSKRIIDMQKKYDNQIEKCNGLNENNKMQEQIFNTMKNEYENQNKEKYEKILYCLYEQEKKYEESNMKNREYKDKIAALEKALNESMIKMKTWSTEYDSFIEEVKYNENQFKNMGIEYKKIFAENEELKEINNQLSSEVKTKSIIKKDESFQETDSTKIESQEYGDFYKWIEKKQFENL